MSNRFQRRQAREQMKKFEYSNYAARTLAEKKNARIHAAKDVFIKQYHDLVEAMVPKWQIKLSEFCSPPKWFFNLICFISNIFYGVKHRNKLKEITDSGKRSWYFLSRFFIARAIYFVFIQSLVSLRDSIYQIGFKAKIERDEKTDTLNFKVFHFGKCIHEDNVKI